MKKQRIFALFLMFVMALSLNLGAVSFAATLDADEPQIVTLLLEDFESGLPTNWSGTGNNPTLASFNGSNYARLQPGRGLYNQLVFDPVALTPAGGSSLGKNVKLVAEYKLAKVAHGDGNGALGGITNSSIGYNGDAFGVSTRMQSDPVPDSLFYYAPYIGSGSEYIGKQSLYVGPDNAATLSGVNIWAQFKFVVSITDADGNYITPTVDVYVTDADTEWVYPDTPVYSGGLLKTYDTVDALRISASGGSPALGIDDIHVYLSYESDGEDGDIGTEYPIPEDADENSRYISVEGGNAPRDGKSWETAFAAGQLQAAWDITPANGTLYVASGEYGNQYLSCTPSNDGESVSSMKRLVGFDTGGGKPVFTDIVPAGSKTSGNTFFSIKPGAKYLWIENIKCNNYAYVFRTDGNNEAIRIYDIDTYNTQDSLYITGAGGPIVDIVVENCYFYVYAKSGVRMANNIHDVLIKDCVADAGGAAEYYPLNWPVGYQISGSDPSSYEERITFVNCVAKNSYEPDGYGSGAGFWNGDGFTAERRSREITYIRCKAFGSTDGGWDSKASTTTLLDCVSIDNKSNYKFWASESAILINCLSAYAYRRGGTGEAIGLECPGGNINLYNCTIMDGQEYEIRHTHSGGTVNLYDCIISRTNSFSLIDQPQDGNINFHDCVIYTNGQPAPSHSNVTYDNTDIFTTGDPQFNDPFTEMYPTTEEFHGDSDRFDSTVYNGSKGYHSKTESEPPQNAKYPVINNQSNNQVVDKSSDVTLFVNADVDDGGTLSYQWFSNKLNSGVGGTRIPGETGTTYSPPTDRLGSAYYYVEVTNTINSKGYKKATTISVPIKITVLGEPDPEPPGPPTERIPVMSEDFENGLPNWFATGTNQPSIAFDNGNSYTHLQPGSNQYIQFMLDEAVALTAAGGESPGKNAKLVAEYKLAKLGGSNGNYIYGSFTDSAAVMGREAFGASTRIDAAPALFQYANAIGSSQTHPLLYIGPPDAAFSGNGQGIWVQFKFVVSITDADSNFITPKVDIYVTDAEEYWFYSDEPIISGGNLLNATSVIDAIRIGTGGGTPIMGIDDINVYLSIELDEELDLGVEQLISQLDTALADGYAFGRFENYGSYQSLTSFLKNAEKQIAMGNIHNATKQLQNITDSLVKNSGGKVDAAFAGEMITKVSKIIELLWG